MEAADEEAAGEQAVARVGQARAMAARVPSRAGALPPDTRPVPWSAAA